jgi:glycosyltransferase involved in cell wall biosynthesis
MRVLLDGDYRRQTEGTGISTYARTLASGLGALDHQVAWLSGATAPARADPLVDEASALDRPPPVRGLRQQAQTAARMLGGLTTPMASARRLSRPDAVTAETGAARSEEVLLAPDLFVRAHYRHMLLRQFTEVRAPIPVDVLHLTAPLPVRMRGVKTAVTIHDLVPARLPYTTPDNKAEFIDRVRTSVALADLVIAVSEASKADIVELLGVDPAKIAVTYQPSDLAPLPPAEHADLPRLLSRFDLSPDGYALFVGAIEPKKNLRRQIEAFLEVDTGLPLVIVGARAWMWEREIGGVLESLGESARKRLRFPGYVSRTDLQRLYAGAHIFLFASLHEGFGLPALDALAAGRPAIVAQTSALPEVCGEAAVYVDPFDRASIRGGIEKLLGDDALRRSLAQKGPAQAEKFSAAAYLDRLRAAYARLGA